MYNLKEELNKEGLTFDIGWEIDKIINIGNRYPFLDIFRFKKIDNTYVNINYAIRIEWPNDYFTEDELLPLKKYKFGKNYYNVPNYSIDYLNRNYLNWEIIGKIGMNHKTNKTCKDNNFWLYGIYDAKIKKYIIININNTEKNIDKIKDIYNKVNNEYILLIITPEREELIKQNSYLNNNVYKIINI